MGHAMRGAEFVQHPSAAHAMPGAQRVGRIIKPGMDHLAVPRGDAVGDPTGHFGDGHFMTGLRRSARDGKPDDASADHQNLHRGSSLESISAGVVDSGPRFAGARNDYITIVQRGVPWRTISRASAQKLKSRPTASRRSRSATND